MQILDLGIGESLLRTFAAFFCKVIYQLIAWMYELFITIARVNILSSEDIAPIYQRITMILTIVMVFYITFEFVKYVVQPDTINDKEKGAGNMALKIIVVILLIAFVPKIFTMAYDLQGRIIDNQLFSKVILGKKEVDMSTYGRGFSADMFSVFYKVNEEACKGCDSEGVVNFNLNRLRDKGDLRYLTAGLNESVSMYNPATQKNEDTPIIDFDGLFAIVVGVVLIYILALYCIDVGTRYAQLIFLQIISPIAIMGYLTPKKDNMFSKWVKQCVTTYLNLFIRIAIIYFVLLICQVLGESYGNGKLFEGLGTISPSIQAFTYIALVMGLLIFANKAPKMLQELFPSSGAAGIGFGLGAKDRIEPTAKALKGTARAVGRTAAATAVAPRAIGGAIKNKTGVWSAVKAMGKGYANTFGKDGGFRKSGQAIRGSIQKDMDTLESGGSPLKSDLFGGFASSKAKRQDVDINQYEMGKKNKDSIRNSADEYKEVKKLKTAWESAKQGGLSQAEIDEAYSKYKNARDAVIMANAKGKASAGNYSYVYKDASGVSHVENIKISEDEVAKFSERVNNNIEASRASIKGTVIEKIKITVNQLDPSTGQPILDSNGDNVKIEKTVGELNDFEYAASIGDISDLAETEISKLKNSSEYKQAHANAEKSGK